ncbi:MmcQ/YjbR family DNA-binding protein [Serratia quinivorans]|uniref:MmcQ/YjbR family DNA-binding protein n=1 Tax=Serratia quinivorans TaxID=137545 RepID=UPI00217ABCAE|nr:MmcQ/YjbR family DNA-binding protein [Serratia quinivorans]CAI0733510.1 Uncharacterized protein conserved in bacteria [Serratia quinivorans]CAI0758711.1 Uncharacterized protein conserved in bacteria [Serratia quinivorans]CAI1667310.1 Uncharacterized protein conserved in bacteria [Serratia quinivorans]CAI2051057.1 Uncharacterized protein conserved in bacteria [Serratia quinivorans]CAI2098788.1 Uncharacterized protein conserved in bacteria [Serratia quinivorans]
MDTQNLVHLADDYARSFPAVTADHSMGKGWATYKLHGKVFMLIGEVEGKTTVVVKADPIRAAILRGQFEEISPAHRMNKRHWLSVVAGQSITKALLHREIKESYLLVQASLSQKRIRNAGQPAYNSVSRRQLQPLARRLANELPAVTHGRPFVEKLDVYKVVNKVFLIITDDPDEPIITVKTEPDQIDTLCEQYENVTPGRYLDKHHWVSIEGGKGVTRELIGELIKQSYRLALKAVPQRLKPPV